MSHNKYVSLFLPALLVSYTVWSQWGSSGFRKGAIYHIPEERESWEDVRENVFNYNEEGGGERDQVWCSFNPVFANPTSFLSWAFFLTYCPYLVSFFFFLNLKHSWVKGFYFSPSCIFHGAGHLWPALRGLPWMQRSCFSWRLPLHKGIWCDLDLVLWTRPSLFLFVENSQNPLLRCNEFQNSFLEPVSFSVVSLWYLPFFFFPECLWYRWTEETSPYHSPSLLKSSCSTPHVTHWPQKRLVPKTCTSKTIHISCYQHPRLQGIYFSNHLECRQRSTESSSWHYSFLLPGRAVLSSREP